MSKEKLMVSDKKLLDIIIEAIKSKRGKDIMLMDLTELSVFAEYFILVTSSSSPQANALIDSIDEAAHKAGVKGIRPQGERNSPWILFDFGSVIVHILTEEARGFYQLERLWSDAKKHIIKDE